MTGQLLPIFNKDTKGAKICGHKREQGSFSNSAVPLFASSWAGKVGISEPPPALDSDQPGLPDWAEWSQRVQVDLNALHEYAHVVYAATDEYLETLSDEELNRSVDLSALGLDPSTVGQLLSGVVLGNVQWHTGEISCLKGLQGAKGYSV